MVDKKETPQGLQTYVSPVIEDGLTFEKAIELLLSFYPDSYGWTKLIQSVDLKADYVITYTGDTPDDITKFGNFVTDTWTNGPTEYTKSPISFSIVGTVQNNTPVAYMYVKDGPFVYGRTCDSATSEWSRIDIQDTSTGLPSFMFQRGDDTPPNDNAIWIKPSYDADGTITSIDALCHLPGATEWSSVYYPGKMDDTIYDSAGKHRSPFEYVGTSLSKITHGYGDFLLHKQNVLSLIHITADERGRWNSTLTVTDLDTLVETAKTNMATLIADEYEKNTKVEETNTNLSTSHDAQVSHIADQSLHVTPDERIRWNSKALDTHVHKAPIDGKVTIAGEKVVSGTIPMDQLPDDIKERVYEIASLDVLANPITDTERHTTYHEGNTLVVPAATESDLTRWYRITDSSRIGTPLYLGSVLEFTNTGSLFDNWNQVRNHPTTLEGYGLSMASREDVSHAVGIDDFSDDPNARITIRKILYDESNTRFLLLANHEDTVKYTHEIVLYTSPTGETWERLPIRFSTIGIPQNAYTKINTISIANTDTYVLCGQQKTADGFGPLILTSKDLATWTKDTTITNELFGTTNAGVVASDIKNLIVVSDGGIWTVRFNVNGTSTHSPYLTFADNVRCNDVMGPYPYAAPMFVAKTVTDAAYSRDTLCYFGPSEQLATIDLASKLNITLGSGGELVIDSVFGGVTTLIIVFRVKVDSTKSFQKKIAQAHYINDATYSQIDLDASLEPFAFVDNYVYCRKTMPTGLQVIKKPMDVIGAGSWEIDGDFDGLDIESIFYEAKIQVSFYVKDRNKIEILALRRNPNAFVRVSPSFSDRTSNSSISDFGSLIYDKDQNRYLCIAYTGGRFGIYSSKNGEDWTVLTPSSTFTDGKDLPFQMRAILVKVDGSTTDEWVLYIEDKTPSPDPTTYQTKTGVYTSSIQSTAQWTKISAGPELETDESIQLVSASKNAIFLVSSKTGGGKTQIYKSADGGTTWTSVWTHTFTDQSVPVRFDQKGSICVLFHQNTASTAVSYPDVIYSKDTGATWTSCTKEAFPVLSEGSTWYSLGGALSDDGTTCYLFVKLNSSAWYIGKADTSNSTWTFGTRIHSLNEIALLGNINSENGLLLINVDSVTAELRYAIQTTAWYSKHVCVITEKNLEFTTIEHLDYEPGKRNEIALKRMANGVDGMCIMANHKDAQSGDVSDYPIVYTSHSVDLQLSTKIYTKEEIDAFFSQIPGYTESRTIYDKLLADESLSLGDADYVGIQEKVSGSTTFPMDDDALATIYIQKNGKIVFSTKISQLDGHIGSPVQKYTILPGFLNLTSNQINGSDFFQRFPVQSKDILDKTTNPNYATSGCGCGWSVTRKAIFDTTIDVSGLSLPIHFSHANGVLQIAYDKYQVVETMYNLSGEDINLAQNTLPHTEDIVSKNQWSYTATIQGESEESVKFIPVMVDGTEVSDKAIALVLSTQSDISKPASATTQLTGYRNYKVEWTPKGATSSRSTSIVDLMEFKDNAAHPINDPLLPIMIHYPMTEGEIRFDFDYHTHNVVYTGDAGYRIDTFWCRDNCVISNNETHESAYVRGGDPEYYFQKEFFVNMESPDREWKNVHSIIYPYGTDQAKLDAMYGMVEADQNYVVCVGVHGLQGEYPQVSTKTQGCIVVSRNDGTRTATVTNDNTNEFVDVAYDGNHTTVAIGNGADGIPRIYYSTQIDTGKFTSVPNLATTLGITSGRLNRIFWSAFKSRFFAAGQKNGASPLIISSSDGITWRVETLPAVSGTCMLNDISESCAVGYLVSTAGETSAYIVSSVYPSTPDGAYTWTQRSTQPLNSEKNIQLTCITTRLPVPNDGIILGKDIVTNEAVAFKMTAYYGGEITLIPISIPLQQEVVIRQIKWDAENQEFIAVGHPNVILTLYGGVLEANALPSNFYDWSISPEVTQLMLNEAGAPTNKSSLVGLGQHAGKWYAFGRTTAKGSQYPILRRGSKHQLMKNPLATKEMYNTRFGSIVYGNGIYLGCGWVDDGSANIDTVNYPKNNRPIFFSSTDGIHWKRIISTVINEDVNTYFETHLTFLNGYFIIEGPSYPDPVVSNTYLPYCHFSKDGETWSVSTFSEDDKSKFIRFDSIASSDTTFIGISCKSDTTIFSKTTGPVTAPLASWASFSTGLPTTIVYKNIAYFAKKKCFVVIGEDSVTHAVALAYSYDDGVTWQTSVTFPEPPNASSYSFEYLACGSDRMIIVGRYTDSGGGAFVFSIFAISPEIWTYNTDFFLIHYGLPQDAELSNVQYMDNAFFMMGYLKFNIPDSSPTISKSFVLRSDTGLMWRRVPNIRSINLENKTNARPTVLSPCVHNNRYIIDANDILIEKDSYGYAPSPKYLTKSNPINDKLDGSPVSVAGLTIVGPIYKNGLFYIAVNYKKEATDHFTNSALLRSDDRGVTWKKVPLPILGDGLKSKINALRYEGGRLVAIGYTGDFELPDQQPEPFIVESVDGHAWIKNDISNASLGIASPNRAILMDIGNPTKFGDAWIAVGYTQNSNINSTINLLVVTRASASSPWTKTNITYSSIGVSYAGNNGLWSLAYNTYGCIAVGWDGNLNYSLGIKFTSYNTAAKYFDQQVSGVTGGITKIVTDPNSQSPFIGKFNATTSKYVYISPTLSTPTASNSPDGSLIQNVEYASSKFYLFCGPWEESTKVYEIDAHGNNPVERADLKNTGIRGGTMSVNTEVWYKTHLNAEHTKYDIPVIYTKGRPITI